MSDNIFIQTCNEVSKTLIQVPELDVPNISGGMFKMPETLSFLSSSYIIFGYEITTIHILILIVVIAAIIYFLYRHYLQKKKDVVEILNKSNDNISDNSSSSTSSSSSSSSSSVNKNENKIKN